MNRMKFSLPVICLVGMAAFATHAWTQDERPTIKPSAGREVPAGDADGKLNSGREEPIGRAPGNPNARNGGRDWPQVPMRAKVLSRTVSENLFEFVPPEEQAAFLAYREARQALKDATNETERKTASEAIRLHLDKQFERDLVQREEDLFAVEERVKMLRQQFDRRKQSKDEIVTLRLKTILNNADGLGFPGDDDPQERSSYPPATGRGPNGPGRGPDAAETRR